MNGTGNILDVAIIQTSQRNASISRQKDAVLARQLIAHVGIHPRKGKHANLSGNMRPVMGTSGLLELLYQQCSHGLDAVGHRLAFAVVLIGQTGIVQNGLDDVGTVNMRAGVHGSDDESKLTEHGLLLFGAVGHDTEGTGTLSVETKVLGKGLSKSHVVSIFYKQAQSGGIGLGITGGKALVGRVKEDVVRLVANLLGNGLPLIQIWITSRRIMGAGMEKNNAAIRSILEILEHAIVIQTVGIGVVITVPTDVETGLLENCQMVSPVMTERVKRENGINKMQDMQLAYNVNCCM